MAMDYTKPPIEDEQSGKAYKKEPKEVEEKQPDLDHLKVYNLLHIAETANQWPTMKWLHDAALAELTKMKVKTKAEKAHEEKEAKRLADLEKAKAEAEAELKKEAEEKAKLAEAKEKHDENVKLASMPPVVKPVEKVDV